MKMFGFLKKLNKNNKGMSLVETLVAVAILSIAVGPILYMFVYTTRYNAKARLKQRATNAAVTVMENLKATDMRTLYRQFYVTDEEAGTHLDSTPFLYGNPGATYSTAGVDADTYEGTYWISNMSFSSASSSDDNKYDVKITAVNGRKEHLTLTPNFDKFRDLIFQERTTDVSLSYDPYYIADSIIKAEGISTDAVEKISVSRDIYIYTAELNEYGARVTSDHSIIVEYKYNYSIKKVGVVTPVVGTYGYVAGDDSRKHLRVLLTLPEIDDLGNHETLGNVYFYYYPAYKNAYTTNDDGSDSDYIINVSEDNMFLENTSHEINLFVSRQYTSLSLEPVKVKILDGKYSLNLSSTDGHTKMVNVYNMLYKTNIVDGSVSTKNGIDMVTGPHNTLIDLKAESGIIEDVSLTTKVTVEVYNEATEDGSHGDPLVTMEGTIVGYNNI